MGSINNMFGKDDQDMQTKSALINELLEQLKYSVLHLFYEYMPLTSIVWVLNIAS